jgi:sulfatase modifying factor 1
MRPIPSGIFTMGSDKFGDDEKPPHRVKLSAFRMGATPVTVAMWREFCVALDRPMPTAPDWGWKGNHPMVNVSWDDASEYSRWASEKANRSLSLPTEAQWEYAARGGLAGKEFPWGDKFDGRRLWCSVNYKRNRTGAVDRTENIHRNGYGLSDMAGNVWEWCRDWYGPYGNGFTRDPQGAPTGEEGRCLRGGTWGNDSPDGFQCVYRLWSRPDDGDNDLGFRLSAGP